MTEHVVAGCVDLNHFKETQPSLAFVSLFDDTEDVWQPRDFSLVEEVTEVARWSNRDEFENLLITA